MAQADKIINKVFSNRFKEGDTFVQYKSKCSLTFMKINAIEGTNEYMDFCSVTWYTLDVSGPHIQRRFPMAARDGVFSGFVPIPRSKYREAVKAMRNYGIEIKELHSQPDINSHYQECCRYLQDLVKDYLQKD